MAVEPDPKTLQLVICDPSGDIMLIVGSQKGGIQVSSKVLKLTSPVFKAMLGPNFKEGIELTKRYVVYSMHVTFKVVNVAVGLLPPFNTNFLSLKTIMKPWPRSATSSISSQRKHKICC